MEIVFATNNRNKLIEVQGILGDKFLLKSLEDIGVDVDIPETQPTIPGNASQKAWFIYKLTYKNCFADDTGLEIEALNGEPGVYSARYAGESKSSEANIIKVLEKLKNQTNRKARFVTAISLVINGKEYLFEGIINGKILTEKHGSNGFGYDPVFQPDGYSETFAEMDFGLKNKISHRAIAINKLADFLKHKF